MNQYQEQTNQQQAQIIEALGQRELCLDKICILYKELHEQNINMVNIKSCIITIKECINTIYLNYPGENVLGYFGETCLQYLGGVLYVLSEKINEHGTGEIIQLLIDIDVDKAYCQENLLSDCYFAINTERFTPLLASLLNCNSDNGMDAIEILVNAGANLNARTRGNGIMSKGIIELICRNPYLRANSERILNMFFNENTSFNYEQKMDQNNTLLHFYCTEIIKFPDWNKDYGKVRTRCLESDFLEFDCLRTKYDTFFQQVAKILIKKVDVNLRNDDGKSALHILCNSQYGFNVIPIIQMLIDAGINLDILDNYNETALHTICSNYVCASEEQQQIVQIFIDKGIDLKNKIYDNIVATFLYGFFGNYYFSGNEEIKKNIANKLINMGAKHNDNDLNYISLSRNDMKLNK